MHRATAYHGLPVWLVTGYAEARELLADPRLSKDRTRALELFPAGTAGGYGFSLSANMLTSDPPDHTRLRRLVNKAFTARTVLRLRPRIEAITEELLGTITSGDRVDLVEALAFPLAIAVISELLGVPDSERGKFRAWSKAFLRADPGRLPRAIEEFLRFDGPINIATVRFATETIRIADAEIRAGEFVLISLLAANRDGGRFARFGTLELEADPATLRWRKSTLIRGLDTLPVRLTAAVTVPGR